MPTGTAGHVGIPKLITRFLPTITQLSLVGSALVVSYGYPLLFGLTIYGSFATATALTFIIQRIIDLIAESTLSRRDPLTLVKSSLIVTVAALGVLALVRTFVPAAATLPFDLWLFVSLVLSTVILNLCFQIGSTVTQFLYATTFGALNLATTLWWFLSGRTDLPLALTITNLLGFGVGAILLVVDHRRGVGMGADIERATNAAMLGQLPYRMMFAAFQIVVTFGAVLIASRHLPAEQVGALRLLTSVAMLGYSLSPVNPKMLYAASREVEQPAHLVRIMRPYVPVFAALCVGWIVATVTIGWTEATAGGHPYFYALALYPVVLFSAVFEKVLLNRKGIYAVGLVAGSWAALVATVLFFGRDLDYYAFSLILAIAAYPLVLATVLSPKFLPMIALVIAVAAAGLLLIAAWFGAAAGVAAVAVAIGLIVRRRAA